MARRQVIRFALSGSACGTQVVGPPRCRAAAGITHEFVQDNQALSRAVGTVRGLHLQLAPFEQGKLVQVLQGATIDVAVDVRLGSPPFGQHAAVYLDANSGNQFQDGLARTVDWYPANEEWWQPILAARYDGSRLGSSPR